MAGESPFEKKFEVVSEKADLAGVLDQLNLPPAFIEFVRANQKIIKIAAIVTVITVITWAFYDSYQTNRLEKSSSALYKGLQILGEGKNQALEMVVADYKGTPASTWAQVELAHMDMKNKQYTGAVEKYSTIRKSLKKTNPLYPLIV